MNKYDKKHLRNIDSYQRKIDEIYSAAATDAASLSRLIGELGERSFSWKDYPLVENKMNEIVKRLKSEISAVVLNGVRAEWELANNKNDVMCRRVFGDNVDKLPKETYNKYFSTNPKALESFIDRKTAGLNLSDRVWKYTNQFKEEIEMGLDVGIRDGLSADKMSRQLRTFLKYPDKLFRRVRDKDGHLRLSKSAAAFHPGRGVYRSSYKNARRLAATESNIAYRTSDYLRWQDLDFVVGIEIHLSNNHTLNGKPFKDICDQLKGRYPKTFKWTGWHPLCRCYATTVQKTDAEFMEDNRRILRGEEPMIGSRNAVKDMPENFNKWVKENQERIENAKSLPYFIRDNKSVVDNILETQKDEQESGGIVSLADLKKSLGEKLPKTLVELEDAIKGFKYKSPWLDGSEGGVNAFMKELFDNNDFGLDIDAEYLESVFDKGFLNTFQTGTSHGHLGSMKTEGLIEQDHARLRMAHRMFLPSTYSPRSSKYKGKQLKRSEYEKYGHLLDRNKTDSYLHNLTQYGDTQVRFKKEKVICTWTFNDSLHPSKEYFQPSLTSDPRVESFDRGGNFIGNHWPTKNGSGESLYKWQERMETRYIELQFHGNLTINDVESITFKDNPEKLISKELINKMEEKGIELWYMNDKKAVKYGS